MIVPAWDVAGMGAIVPAWDVAGLSQADLVASYEAARQARVQRDAEVRKAQVEASRGFPSLDPVVIPEAQPFPKALTWALALAGVAAVGVVLYSFTRRGSK